MKCGLVLLSSLLLSTPAHADSGVLAPASAGEHATASTEKELVLAIGAGPAYPGARRRNAYIGLGIEASFGNGIFIGGKDGIGYRFLETPSGLSMAASISALQQRREKDGEYEGRNRLAGMGDIGARATANLIARYDAGPVHFRAALTHALGSRKNTLIGVDGIYDLYADKDNLVRASTGFEFGNRSTMQTFFGVTQQQSASSSNAVYIPGAGIAELHASLDWRHAFSARWVGSLGAGFASLRNAAADSPLVERRNSAYGAATIAYRF